MDLTGIETQLKKRCRYRYKWFRKQNDSWDRLSKFIYNTRDWEQLNESIALRVATEKLPANEFFQYCSIRWFNFWSARAIEAIFAEMPGITPDPNAKNRTRDFSCCGIDFDLKTSVFPRNFKGDLVIARKNPQKLLRWLYQNQSRQQRFHLENRLFLMVYSSKREHWKLKAEISWLREIIEKYVLTFETSQLKEFQFKPGKTTFSDIIWAIE